MGLPYIFTIREKKPHPICGQFYEEWSDGMTAYETKADLVEAVLDRLKLDQLEITITDAPVTCELKRDHAWVNDDNGSYCERCGKRYVEAEDGE